VFIRRRRGCSNPLTRQLIAAAVAAAPLSKHLPPPTVAVKSGYRWRIRSTNIIVQASPPSAQPRWRNSRTVPCPVQRSPPKSSRESSNRWVVSTSIRGRGSHDFLGHRVMCHIPHRPRPSGRRCVFHVCVRSLSAMLTWLDHTRRLVWRLPTSRTIVFCRTFNRFFWHLRSELWVSYLVFEIKLPSLFQLT